MADTEDDFDLSIATAVAMQMHSFFDKGSEVMNQSKELIEAVEFAQDQAKELRTLLKDKYVGKGNLLKE